MKKIIVSLILFLFLISLSIAKENIIKGKENIENFSFLNLDIIKDYNFILSSCFDENKIVDYEKIKLNSERINKILNFFKDYDRNFQNNKEEIIFYISYVNMFLINHVAKQYPLKSLNIFIKQNDVRALKSIENIKIPFKDKNNSMTIGQIIKHVIELDKVAPNYGNVRTLFSFYFLSKDAPKFNFLIFNLYLLSRNLDECVRNYLYNKNFFEVDRNSDTVYLSGFLKRYSKFFNINFNKNDNTEIKNTYLSNDDLNIVKFLLDYVSSNDKVFLKNNIYKIVYRRDNFVLDCV